jgi:3-hydroxyisobutyrate dehydrogenase
MSKVAFIGLGAMGSRMAANLLRAGHEVTVCDLIPEATKKLVAAGAKAATSPQWAAQGSDFVLTMVRDDEASRQVWLDPNTGALAGMKSGTIAIEISTLTPAWIRELGTAIGKAGIDLLEAPVSGSTPQAKSADLVFLVGGNVETLKRAEPVLRALGSSIQFAGSIGSGALAKLVTNTFMGVQLATLAEMIVMLHRQQVDIEQVLHAVAGTPIWNPHLTNDAESMLSGNFEAHFPIKLLVKDLNYTVNTAGGEISAPTVNVVRGLFQKAISNNLGDLNMTAIVKLFGKPN